MEVDFSLFPRCVSGQRFICHSDNDGHTRMVIFDFNVHPRQTDVFSTGDVTKTTVQLVTTTVVPARDVFLDAVTTHLPYRVISRKIDENYRWFIIDEDRIFAIKRDGREMYMFM